MTFSLELLGMHVQRATSRSYQELVDRMQLARQEQEVGEPAKGMKMHEPVAICCCFVAYGIVWVLYSSKGCG